MTQASEHSSAVGRSEWREGWRTVVGGTLGYGGGAAIFILTYGLFVEPIREATGWSTVTIMITPVIQLMWSLLQPVAGHAVAKLGARPTATLGAITLAVLLVFFYVLPFNLFVFYGFALLLGFLGPFTWQVPFMVASSTWFRQNSGLAFGLMLSGGSALGSALITPVAVWSIYTHGWKSGFLVLAGVLLLVSAPASFFLLRERVRSADELAAEQAEELASVESLVLTGRHPMRTIRFWALTIPLAIASFVTAGYLSNLQPLMLQTGMSVEAATTVSGAFFIFIGVGGILSGFLVDRIWPYLVTLVLFGATGLGSFVFINVSPSTPSILAILAAAAIGMSLGSTGDLPGFFILREYGRAAFVKMLPLAYLVIGVFGASGPLAFGIIRDATGNYQLMSLIAGISMIFAGVLSVVTGLSERSATNRNEPAEDLDLTTVPVS